MPLLERRTTSPCSHHEGSHRVASPLLHRAFRVATLFRHRTYPAKPPSTAVTNRFARCYDTRAAPIKLSVADKADAATIHLHCQRCLPSCGTPTLFCTVRTGVTDCTGFLWPDYASEHLHSRRKYHNPILQHSVVTTLTTAGYIQNGHICRGKKQFILPNESLEPF